MGTKLKNLPYSKNFKHDHCARIHLGENPESWNKCGAESGRGYTDSVLLPAGDDPFKFHWPVRNLDVLILNSSGGANTTQIERIMLACLTAGALIVMALMPTKPLVVRP